MEFSSGQSFGTKSLFYLRLVLERTLPSGVIYLGELRPTWDHVHKSCILTLDKIGGEGGPAKNLHGVGRLVCPEGLAHRQNRIGLEASAGLMERQGTAQWEGLWAGNSHLPARAHTCLWCFLLLLHGGGAAQGTRRPVRLGIDTVVGTR